MRRKVNVERVLNYNMTPVTKCDFCINNVLYHLYFETFFYRANFYLCENCKLKWNLGTLYI